MIFVGWPSASKFSKPMAVEMISLLLYLSFLSSAISSTSIVSFIYGGCSQANYAPSSPFEANLNSLFTSFVNSAGMRLYNNFSIAGATSWDVLYGLYQCRQDLSDHDCSSCIANAVTQLGALCRYARGGHMQLDGCFVKYDTFAFLGVEDKSLVWSRCGPTISSDPTASSRIDGALSCLSGGGGPSSSYRAALVEGFSGVAQCVQDLSVVHCQDCLAEAIGRLRTSCGASASGDVFLATCYGRFSAVGSHGGSRLLSSSLPWLSVLLLSLVADEGNLSQINSLGLGHD